MEACGIILRRGPTARGRPPLRLRSGASGPCATWRGYDDVDVDVHGVSPSPRSSPATNTKTAVGTGSASTARIRVILHTTQARMHPRLCGCEHYARVLSAGITGRRPRSSGSRGASGTVGGCRLGGHPIKPPFSSLPGRICLCNRPVVRGEGIAPLNHQRRLLGRTGAVMAATVSGPGSPSTAKRAPSAFRLFGATERWSPCPR